NPACKGRTPHKPPHRVGRSLTSMVRAILNACQEIVAKNPDNYDIAYIPVLRKRGRCGSLSLSLLLLRDSLLSGNGNLRCYRIRCGKTHGSVDSLLDTILPF